MICEIKEFNTREAYLNDGRVISIEEYIIIEKENGKQDLFCKENHELVFVNGDKNTPHFRHNKNENCSLMTQWHKDWQNKFDLNEVIFKYKKNQIKERRADVFLKSYNIVVEFQHSNISFNEVKNRKHDYQLHDIKTIWIIDGTDINYDNSDDNKDILYFSDKWKYESFLDYDNIYIDINNHIYGFNPNIVKNKSITVSKPYNKEYFIECLKANKMESIVKNPEKQCKMILKQQGAGNGKTYEIIQELISDNFDKYDQVIIATKQNSNVYIIHQEYVKEIEKRKKQNLHNIEIGKLEKINKKYSFTFKKNSKEKVVVLTTVDSLTNALGDKNHKEFDHFEGIVNSIIDDYINKNNKNNFTVASNTFKLNKKLCLVVDETQDLNLNYAKAIIKIMESRYIDTYIVGDKMQSIFNDDNAFTCLLEDYKKYPLIDINIDIKNICRRFTHPTLVNLINELIDYKYYQCHEITTYKDNVVLYDNPVTIFSGQKIYTNDRNENKLFSEVELIMDLYTKEVNESNRKPNSFLIVTPFTKKNPLVTQLQTAINLFWCRKYNTYDMNYAVFHKSENYGSIDLSLSDNSTRIVSIHTSKGDGRPVVFVIGLTEIALRIYSTDINLQYDSLFNVSITRQKEKLYFRLELNGDDIHQRFLRAVNKGIINDIEISPIIVNDMRYDYNNDYSKIMDSFMNQKNYKELNDKLLKNYNHNILNEDDIIKDLIDMGFHNIRGKCLSIYFHQLCVYTDKDKYDKTEQLECLLSILKNKQIHNTQEHRKFIQYLEDKEISILVDGKENRDSFLNCVFRQVKNRYNSEKGIDNFKSMCTLQCIVMYYMLDIIQHGKYTDFSFNELYDILKSYKNNFNNDYEGHYNCICKEIKTCDEIKTEINNHSENDRRFQNLLKNHFHELEKAKSQYISFFNHNSKLKWLRDKRVFLFNDKTNDLRLSYKFQYIGYNHDSVFIPFFYPNISTLNVNTILIKSLFLTYLLSTIKKSEKNNDKKDDYERFANKKIVTVIFCMNMSKYKIIYWGDNFHIYSDFLKDILYDKIKESNKSNISLLYNFFKTNVEKISKTESKLKKIRFELNEHIDKKIHYKDNKKIDEPQNKLLKNIQKLPEELTKKELKDEEFIKNKLKKYMESDIKIFFNIDDSDDETYDSDF